MAKPETKKRSGINANLIAPCGMNCRLCVAYVRDKNTCPGCRSDDRVKPKTRFTCRIKRCEEMAQHKARYCFDCDTFPCDRLKHLDKRYRTTYGMSMVDNLVSIRELGIRRFLRNEKEKWACPACGEMLCVHKPQCLSCGHAWR
jgi:hypothetical protein